MRAGLLFSDMMKIANACGLALDLTVEIVSSRKRLMLTLFRNSLYFIVLLLNLL